MVFDGLSFGTGSVTLYIWSEIDTYYSYSPYIAASKTITNSSRGTVEISVPAGSYYVGFAVFANESDKQVTMYNLYLQ